MVRLPAPAGWTMAALALAACGADPGDAPADADADAAIDPSRCSRQPWDLIQLGTAAPDVAVAVVADAACNVTIAGSTFGDLGPGQAGLEDVFVRRLPRADDGWLRQLGSASWDQVGGLAVTPAGDVIVVGTTSGQLPGAPPSAGNDDVFALALDPSGARRWTTQYGTAGHDLGLGVALAEDGGLVIAGAVDPDVNGDYDATLAQLDGRGRVVADQVIATDDRGDRGEAVAVAPGRGVVLVGGTLGPLAGDHQGSFDAFVVEHPAVGAARTWGAQPATADIDAALDVAVDRDGSLLVLLVSYADLETGRSEDDGRQSPFVARFEPGDPVPRWVRRVGPATAHTAAGALALDDAGRIYLAGLTEGALDGPSRGGRDAFVAVLDRDGALIRAHQLGTAGDDRATDVVVTAAGDVVVVGVTAGDLTGRGEHAGEDDVFVARFDAPPR